MLPQISVSVKAVIVSDGKVLLLSYDDGEFHYNLPGGKARKGESLRQAVVRKVLEETGIETVATKLLFVVEYVPERWDGEYGDVQKVQFQFLAEPLGEVVPRKSDPPDPHQIGFEWVPLSELKERYLLPKITGQLVDALTNEWPDAFVDQW